MINWIFFDVGNVILNDDPAMVVLYKYLHDIIKINQTSKNVTFEKLLQYREQAILENRDGKHYHTVGIKFLGEKRWRKEFKIIRRKLSDNWGKLSPLLPGIIPVIQNLSGQFNLGLIANQPRVTESILNNYQLMQYFKVNCLSAFVGYRKPDKRIFEHALKSAECSPEKAIMIGDRIDNDIAPAKAIGFKTIWLKLPLEKKGYEPATEFEKLYFQSIRRASVSQMAPQTNNEKPDFIADSFKEIVIIGQNIE